MSKITLTDLANLQNETTAVNAINSNNATLEAAFDNTLSRDGSTPNQMESDLDMNSNRIINLVKAVDDTEPVRLKELNDILFDLIDGEIPDGSIQNIKLVPVPANTIKGNLTGSSAPVTDIPVDDLVDYISDQMTGDSATFGTKALFEGATIPSLVTTVSLTGYYANGDLSKPSNYLRLDSTPIPVEAWHIQSSDGAWWVLNELEPTLDMFGTVGDGVTDDTAKWDDAINYTSSIKGKLIIPEGDYSIENGTLKGNIKIEALPGARIVQPDRGSVTSPAPSVLIGEGTVGATQTLGAFIEVGTVPAVLTVADTSAFEVGDWVLVRDDDYVFEPAVAGRNQEIGRVAEKTATTLTLVTGLTSSFYTADNAEVCVLNPIENLEITGPLEVLVGLNCAYGIRLKYLVNSHISNGVTVKRPRGGGALVFQTAFNSHISFSSVLQGQSPSSGGLGYGVSLDESCTFCSVTDCYFSDIRENTFTNRARHCLFARNVVNHSHDTGWNTHGAGSSDCVCENNLFMDCSQGVSLSWSGVTRADINNTVQNNRMIRCTNGISVQGSSSQRGSGNVIQGNMIENPSQFAIYCYYNDDCVVANNVVRKINTTAGLNLIYTLNSTDVVVAGNSIDQVINSAGTSIRVTNSTNVAVHANRLVSASGLAFWIPAGNSGVSIVNNTVVNSGTNIITGVSVDKFNSWN